MLKRFDRWLPLWPCLLFLALIIFSLRDVLVLPGTIGYTWDWELSASASQLWTQLSRDFFVWNHQLRGGYYAPLRSGAWFSFLALPFSIFGGEVLSRLFIIVSMFLAAVGMRQFTSRVLRLNSWWSTIAGALYMFSPVVYSRIMAGHNLLLPYALLPFCLLYLYRVVHGCAEDRLPVREIIAAGVFLGLQGIHPSMMVLALVVVGLVISIALMKTRHRAKTLLSAMAVVAIFTLLNIYWALPMASGYLFSGTLYHSGSSLDNPDQVTGSAVISQRENLFQNTMQSMQVSLRQQSNWGYATEFDYPIPNELSAIWLVASFLLPIAAFGALLFRTESKDVHLALALAALLGAVLVSGMNVPIGAAIYEWLMLHVFPVWAEFGNTARGLPLVALAYSALAPALLQQLSEKLRGWIRSGAITLAVFILSIYVFPFLSSSTWIDSKNYFSLKSYQPSVADQRLDDYLKNDSEDFRVAYVPPSWLTLPENYDLGYLYTGGTPPHSEFSVPYFNPQAWLDIYHLRSDQSTTIVGKLLGLGAVKYIIYPQARFINPALGISPPALQPDNSVRARFVDQALSAQKNLTPISIPLTGTLVFQNDSYLPHVYAASRSALIPGDSNALSAFANSSFFDRQPAIFFSAQQAPQDLPQLAANVDRVVQVGSRDVENQVGGSTRTPAYIFDATPFTKFAPSFSVPRESSYTIRVKANSFQSFPPRSDEASQATFDKIESGPDMNWSGNLPYDYSLAADSSSLQVVAYLDDSSSKNSYVQLDQSIESMNLVDYPYLRLESLIENPSIQAITAQVSLDFDGDGKADEVWSSPALVHASFKIDAMNVFERVRQDFPDKPHYHAVGIGVRFQRKPLEAWERVGVAPRLYAFQLRDMGFYQQTLEGKPGWAWQLPKNLGIEKPVSLSRELDKVDISRFPVLVEYQSNGPALLYVETALTIQSRNGTPLVIPAGTQLLEPFSTGTITLDQRNQLMQLARANGEPGYKPQVIFTVRRLRGSPALRPTTFTLARVGVQWLPSAAEQPKSQSPTLMVDGKPVNLKEMQPDVDRLRYTTASLKLSEGKHQISALYSDSNSSYAVESIEVEPVAEQPKPLVPPMLSFEKINPTRFRVHVTNAQAPYFLVFSENFHANWSACVEPAINRQSADSQLAGSNTNRWYAQSALLSELLDGNRREQLPEHYLVNGYANSWRVDKSGTYDVVIEFVPQRIYEGGLVISISTFLGGIFFLGVTWFNRCRKGNR